MSSLLGSFEIHQKSMAGEDISIDWDGRLDNRKNLLDILKLNPEAKADGQIIIEAYRRWGVDCVQKFQGDFAFALADYQKQILFCARDPLGIRPFHYMLRGHRFLFSSHITPLARSPMNHKEV